MAFYLYYDVKGIQSFIFKIPKLKFVIGGSALIDKFDKKTVPKLAEDMGLGEPVFTGGGRGMIPVNSEESAGALRGRIMKAAHDIGLDISFRFGKDYRGVMKAADELHPFMPHLPPEPSVPCPESGLYPVPKQDERIHPVVEERLLKKNIRWFEEQLLGDIDFPVPSGMSLEFFRNVNPDDPDHPDQDAAGFNALGGRNRWAVICMDGNDMGRQFGALLNSGLSEDEIPGAVGDMSEILGNITSRAAKSGIGLVVNQWAGNEGKEAFARGGRITLPIRPLLVGGDDIVVLCRCNYAAPFVKEVCRVFEKESLVHKETWKASKNGLTISAGILYTSVTLPLHTAIPYAEALLESAKTLGRKLAGEGQAPPACIDWEQVTESVIDTPGAKRLRELTFYEKTGDVEKRIQLTQRPYTLADFTGLERKAEDYERLPRTLRQQILPALRMGRQDRMAFAARVKKHHSGLFTVLNEHDARALKNSAWEDLDGETRTTWLPDALLLIEERERMDKEAAYDPN